VLITNITVSLVLKKELILHLLVHVQLVNTNRMKSVTPVPTDVLLVLMVNTIVSPVLTKPETQLQIVTVQQDTSTLEVNMNVKYVVYNVLNVLITVITV